MTGSKRTRKMFLLFNHTLTEDQEKEAKDLWGVTCFVPLPPDLKTTWAQVPSDRKEISGCLDPVRRWLEKQAEKNDLALIQGDFGAAWLMVHFAFEKGLIPVYSVTFREAREEAQPDGTIKNTHMFRHKRFRAYGE